MFAALLIFGSLVLAGYAVATMMGARQEASQTLKRRLAAMTGLSDGVLRAGVLKDRRLSALRGSHTAGEDDRPRGAQEAGR